MKYPTFKTSNLKMAYGLRRMIMILRRTVKGTLFQNGTKINTTMIRLKKVGERFNHNQKKDLQDAT